MSLSAEIKSVLLTGGNGFVGSALLSRLMEEGYLVTVGGRKKPSEKHSSFLEFDLTSSSSIKAAFVKQPGFDIVINAAGSLRKNCDIVNREGTRLLLKHLGNRAARWIQLGSAGVYQNDFQGNINELTYYEPVTEYEKSKFLSDREVKENHTDYIILRPTMVAGVGMNGAPLKLLSRSLAVGIYPMVASNTWLNLVSLEDVVDAVLHICKHPPSAHFEREFILSDDFPIRSTIELLASELPISGFKLKISKSILQMAATLGTCLGLELFNRRRFSILTNQARFDASRFCQIYPEWPRVGSRCAIAEFARSLRKC